MGWERVVVDVSELWDIKRDGPALTGPSLNKLVREGKTKFVVDESGGTRRWRDGIEQQDGSRTISNRGSCI